MADFHKVAKTGDMEAGKGKCVEVNGKKIALFNVEGSYYAIDNACTHKGGPLCEGQLSGNEVTCPWHAGKFDVTTGAALSPPAVVPVNKYNVRVSGEDIEVEA